MMFRPAFLILPAYLVGIFAVMFTLQVLPTPTGIAISALLVLCMLTPLSLLHLFLNDSLEAHGGLYLIVFLIAYIFALIGIPADIGPAVSTTSDGNPAYTWLQVGYVVLQQILYFGIHAFRRG